MDREKYVDESWKESAWQEKEKLDEISGGAKPKAQPTASAQPQSSVPSQEVPAQEQTQGQSARADEYFLNHISSLAYQAMIFMGEMPNPNTNLIDKNLEQAKFLIDTLAMLRVKTKGNLAKQEADLINATLYELQMRFVDIAQKEGIA